VPESECADLWKPQNAILSVQRDDGASFVAPEADLLRERPAGNPIH